LGSPHDLNASVRVIEFRELVVILWMINLLTGDGNGKMEHLACLRGPHSSLRAEKPFTWRRMTGYFRNPIQGGMRNAGNSRKLVFGATKRSFVRPSKSEMVIGVLNRNHLMFCE